MQPRRNFSGSKIRIWDALDETIGQRWCLESSVALAREDMTFAIRGHAQYGASEFPKWRCDRKVKAKKRIPTRRILFKGFPMSKHGWGPYSYRASAQLAENGPVFRTFFCQHDGQPNRTLARTPPLVEILDGGDGFRPRASIYLSRDAPARACSSCPRPSATFARICLKPEDSPLDVGCRAGLGSSRCPGPWPAAPGPVCRRGLDRLETGNEWQRELDDFPGPGSLTPVLEKQGPVISQDTMSQRIQVPTVPGGWTIKPVEVPNMRR
ncbi:predicted protein [Chaetomium globosum CBS 148.51]|uniref:Uncharacterized protein n=1 Tax=Chaetomium globosum (strain ATCC 6205 / CBS 148.51 / DSM 1962 / NBRC 6347 / NRRL 1970) TaxID=306901 RepID=Q2H5Q9_CHAGB|nr:uncharacterized protein CHGG_06006 [Chaetomium globosum CBS 148.51]EAQ89387.1 predicted protein [Chaetomium globosum CBS 148.51]